VNGDPQKTAIHRRRRIHRIYFVLFSLTFVVTSARAGLVVDSDVSRQGLRLRVLAANHPFTSAIPDG
jgi:hypothetical protein